MATYVESEGNDKTSLIKDSKEEVSNKLLFTKQGIAEHILDSF